MSNYFLPTLQGSLVTVNPSHDFFKTPEARMAFLKSIDQAALVKQVLGKRSPSGDHHVRQGHDPGRDRQAGHLATTRTSLKKYVDALPPNANKTW